VRENSPKALRFLRGTILLLVLDLVFEGLARKLNIHGTSTPIFFFKDLLVVVLGVQILILKRPAAVDFLWVAYMVELVLFIPLLVATAAHDPLLAVFGVKEYLLYPIVAFAVFTGFEKVTMGEVIGFFRWLALLLLPTTALALIELRLPASHWLNMSVEGDSLEGFSAGGYLRVSSTFSFVAQYCAYLNATVFILMIALQNMKTMGFFKKSVFLSLIPLLVISSYVTGSRGAVLVNCVIIGLAAGLCLMTLQARSAIRIMVIIGGLLITLSVSKYAFPDAFTAYSTREEGHFLGATSEIQQRIYSAMFDWMRDAFTTPALGYGLGVMSNGSDKLSSYASATRAFSWTETDFATTLFEGGLYLIFIWYAFRYFVIYQVVRRFLATAGSDLSVPASFCVSYVMIVGFTATLGIQPPIAIWWWLAVGTALTFWWKCMQSKDLTRPTGPAPTAPKKVFRGQSAYAGRLHKDK
jgi:hypothetical protein